LGLWKHQIEKAPIVCTAAEAYDFGPTAGAEGNEAQPLGKPDGAFAHRATDVGEDGARVATRCRIDDAHDTAVFEAGAARRKRKGALRQHHVRNGTGIDVAPRVFDGIAGIHQRGGGYDEAGRRSNGPILSLNAVPIRAAEIGEPVEGPSAIGGRGAVERMIGAGGSGPPDPRPSWGEDGLLSAALPHVCA